MDTDPVLPDSDPTDPTEAATARDAPSAAMVDDADVRRLEALEGELAELDAALATLDAAVDAHAAPGGSAP